MAILFSTYCTLLPLQQMHACPMAHSHGTSRSTRTTPACRVDAPVVSTCDWLKRNRHAARAHVATQVVTRHTLEPQSPPASSVASRGDHARPQLTQAHASYPFARCVLLQFPR